MLQSCERRNHDPLQTRCIIPAGKQTAEFMRNPTLHRGAGLRSALLLFSTLILTPGSAPGQELDRTTHVGFRDSLANGRPCPHCPEMIPVPPGRFLMGAQPAEGHSNEYGPHQMQFPVRMSAPLAVGVTAVTRAQFAVFAAANSSAPGSSNCTGIVTQTDQRGIGLTWRNPGYPQADDHPVVCVSWEQAKAYTRWLSTLTGRTYRLLTEAEWEYTARGGTQRRYWWGERMRPRRTNCLDRCGEDFPFTAPVRSFLPNPFGLYNVLGNVWEWVEDCYDAHAYRLHYSDYPQAVAGPADCRRVIRGGSWQDGPWSLRAANRDTWRSGRSLNDIGFRVARLGGDIPI